VQLWQEGFPKPLANVPGLHCGHEVLPDAFVAVPVGQGVQGMKPFPLKKPGPHNAEVPHWGPVKPTLHEHVPLVVLLFRHVPFPLHAISQPEPLEHGLQVHTELLRLHTPAPLQLRGHGPTADTREAGKSVNSVLPIASAASTLSMVRPDDFCM